MTRRTVRRSWGYEIQALFWYPGAAVTGDGHYAWFTIARVRQ